MNDWRIKLKGRNIDKKWVYVGILVYTLILFCLNFIRIFDFNFWGDEGFTIKLAKMTVSNMLWATANDVHPPLYYFISMVAYRIFGQYGWVFHGVSLCAYLLELIIILTIIYKKFGTCVACLMVTFTSILERAVCYNVEARMYSWAALFVLLAYYELLLILEKDDCRAYVLFVLFSLCAAYTHYYAMMSVAYFYFALLIWTIIKRCKLKRVFWVYISTFIGYLPWLISMISTFKRTSEDYWMTAMPSLSYLTFFFYSSNFKFFSIVMLAIPIVIVIFLCIQEKMRLSVKTYWLLSGIVASIGTLMIGIAICYLVRPSFAARFLFPVASVMWLVFSVSVSIYSIKYKNIMCIICIGATLAVSVPQYIKIYQEDKYENALCVETYNHLNRVINDDDIILTNGKYLDWTVLEYYFMNEEYLVSNHEYSSFYNDKDYWLIWTEDLDTDDKKWIEKNGFEVSEEYHNGILGTQTVHVFRLFKE